MIDLLSNDVQRLEGQTLMLILGSILDLTLVIPGTVFFLVYLIGWQALMGVICLFFWCRISQRCPLCVLHFAGAQQQSQIGASLC